MRFLVWSIFVVLAALWTGASALLAAGLQWAAAALAGGTAADLAAALGNWQLPNWLMAWMDLGWLTSVQAVVVQLVDKLQAWWPNIGQAVAWLVPMVWLGWGLVLFLLLLLAVLAHVLVGRLGRGGKPPAAGAQMA